MTTAHRPTWAPAKGHEEQGGARMFGPSHKHSKLDDNSHTILKKRSAPIPRYLHAAHYSARPPPVTSPNRRYSHANAWGSAILFFQALKYPLLALPSPLPQLRSTSPLRIPAYPLLHHSSLGRLVTAVLAVSSALLPRNSGEPLESRLLFSGTPAKNIFLAA
jgi:hypothetical protein